MSELMPCPLCGGEVKIYDFAGYEIVCKCGVMFAPDSPTCETEKGAVKAWNTRANDVCDD